MFKMLSGLEQLESDKYKLRLNRLGVEDVDKVVKDLFDDIGYTGRLIIWYWHHKKYEGGLKDE